ncbi:MAG: type II secretion system F family protein [Candidatus Omnitrophota bacterium]|nr:type II secretion system F family protein [Candidatus Omnitrophota bacterium]
MPKYLYKAKKNIKETFEGVIEEASQDAVVARLVSQGLTPISVALQEQSVTASTEASVKPKKIRRRKISLTDITVFTRQLHTLVKSRVELLSSLRILEEQQDNLLLKNVIKDLFNNVKDGLSFSQALGKHPDIFSRLYVNMVTSGEASGRLEEALGQLCIYLGRIEDLRMKLRQALAYPILMICVGLLSIFVLITFVIPRMANMFNDLDMVLPLPTRILLQMGSFLKVWWPAVIVFFGIIIFMGLRGGNTGKGKAAFLGQFKYRIPVVKKLLYKQAIINFTTTLSLLLRSGVSLLEALRISIPLLDDRRLVQELDAAREQIKAGASFSQSLQSARFFSPFLVQMIRVGEEGGRLEGVISEVANSYVQELESDLKIVSSLIEPMIILILGIAIGTIVISMLLPIFQINILAQ